MTRLLNSSIYPVPCAGTRFLDGAEPGVQARRADLDEAGAERGEAQCRQALGMDQRRDVSASSRKTTARLGTRRVRGLEDRGERHRQLGAGSGLKRCFTDAVPRDNSR